MAVITSWYSRFYIFTVEYDYQKRSSKRETIEPTDFQPFEWKTSAPSTKVSFKDQSISQGLPPNLLVIYIRIFENLAKDSKSLF